MKYCGKHLHEIGHEIRRRGWWRYVDSAKAKQFMWRWIGGTATMDEIDPLVITMLELGAKAARMHAPWSVAREQQNGVRQDVAIAVEMRHCPLCVIEKLTQNASAAPAQIAGVIAHIVEPLMRANDKRGAVTMEAGKA